VVGWQAVGVECDKVFELGELKGVMVIELQTDKTRGFEDMRINLVESLGQE
jgi:hypothetical protein